MIGTPSLIRTSRLGLWVLVVSVLAGVSACSRERPSDPTWPIRSGEFVQVQQLSGGETSEIYQLVFSPDGEHLLASYRDGVVCLWDLATEETVLECDHPTSERVRIVDVAFTPDGKQFLSGGGETVRLWDVATGEMVHETRFPGTVVHAVASTADGRGMFVGTHDGGIHIVDLVTGQAREVFNGGAETCSLAVSPDGKLLISGHSILPPVTQKEFSVTPPILVWDIENETLLGELWAPEDTVLGLCFSSDGTCVVGTVFGMGAYVWDVATGEVVASFGERTEEEQTVWFDTSASPTGHRLLMGGDRVGVPDDQLSHMMLWDWEEQKQIAVSPPELPGHVFAVAFSPDGQRVASGDDKGVIRIWRLPDE